MGSDGPIRGEGALRGSRRPTVLPMMGLGDGRLWPFRCRGPVVAHHCWAQGLCGRAWALAINMTIAIAIAIAINIAISVPIAIMPARTNVRMPTRTGMR